MLFFTTGEGFEEDDSSMKYQYMLICQKMIFGSLNLSIWIVLWGCIGSQGARMAAAISPMVVNCRLGLSKKWIVSM